MTPCKISVATLLTCAALVWPAAAAADTADASCEVRQGGEVKRGRSGPCDFSQRQGHVRIDLRNGDTWELRPTNRANEYKDQKGHVVKRSFEGRAHVYRWEGKRIIVTFAGNNANRPGQRPGQGSTAHGQTPRDLRDMVGGRWVGGEVADEMNRRGYRSIRDEVSGNRVYSYYRGHSDCVTVQLDGQRRVRSIVAGPDADCRRGQADHQASGTDKHWYPRLYGNSPQHAANMLQDAGFRQVDTFASGRNGVGTVWYKPSSRECLQVIAVEQAVDSVNDIGSHPRCR